MLEGENDMLEKKTLLKLYWRGNKINNYFLLVVFVLFVMFFLKSAIPDNNDKIERLKKELHKIEYFSDLTIKIKKRDFDGRDFVIEKPTWVTQASPDKYESNSKNIQLIRRNTSSKEKKDILEIYNQSLKKNGWIEKNDFKYEKSDMILELSNFHVELGMTEWDVLIKVKMQ